MRILPILAATSIALGALAGTASAQMSNEGTSGNMNGSMMHKSNKMMHKKHMTMHQKHMMMMRKKHMTMEDKGGM